MISSSRQAIACILLLLPTIIFAQSQSVSDKEPNGTVSGRVTVKGDAVSGVVVGLISGDRRAFGSAVQKAVTDDEGNYRITNVKPGTYELAVASLTYVLTGSINARKALIVGKDETIENLDFNLVRGGVITGKITDSEGRPVIEINVAISPAQSDHLSSLRPSLRTDDRGIYRAFGLPPGSYIISAGQAEQSMGGESLTRYGLTYHPAAAQRSQATIVEVTEGSESTGVDIALGRPTLRYFASGRIVDGENGKPVANVRYGVSRFVRQAFGGFHSGGKTTNEQGEFKLPNLPPGSYAVVAESDAGPDLRVEPHRFEVVDRDVTGLIVKTTKGGSVSGVLILEETESRGPMNLDRTQVIASVVTRIEVRELNRTALTKADGTFRIGGLPGGELRLWVSGRNNLQLIRVERDGVVYPRGFDIKELEHLTGVRLFVASANGMLRGFVKLANGSPPPENRVSVTVRRLSDDDPEGGMMRATQVDTRGEFVVDRLLPGTYEVSATFNSATPFESPNSKSKRAIQQVVVTNDNVSSIALTLPEQ